MKRRRPIQIADVNVNFMQLFDLSCGPGGVPDQICGGAQTSVSQNLGRAWNSLGRKITSPVRRAVHRPARHHAETRNRRPASRYGVSAGTGGSSSGFAGASRPRNARLRFSSMSAVPRQSDEDLAKSSAKWINFSRQAGSLISRNARIRRTPSLGSASSGSRSLLTSSPRLLCFLLPLIFCNPLV
jgi:hypothetical protein